MFGPAAIQDCSGPGVFADEEAIETFGKDAHTLIQGLVREYSLTKKRLRPQIGVQVLPVDRPVREYSLTKKRLRHLVLHGPRLQVVSPGVFADEEAIETSYKA